MRLVFEPSPSQSTTVEISKNAHELIDRQSSSFCNTLALVVGVVGFSVSSGVIVCAVEEVMSLKAKILRSSGYVPFSNC